MRSNMYTFFQMMHNIEQTWDERGVIDATTTEEWDDYESFLYTTVAWIIGDIKGFNW